MIIYGRRSTFTKAEIIFDQCPNCKNSNVLQINIFQWYVHIFWIPIIPAGKYGVSVCNNCNQVLKEKQMPPSLKFSLDNVKRQAKVPIWNFVGLLLIGLGVIAAIISGKYKEEKVSKLVLAPKKDDIFQIKIKDGVYTLYKVFKVEGEIVFFYSNKYETNQESGLSDLKQKEFETKEMYEIPIKSLIEMNKKEEIIDIERN